MDLYIPASDLEEAERARKIFAEMPKINLPGKDSDEYKEYKAKLQAQREASKRSAEKFAEKQAQAKVKKVADVVDAVEGFKLFEEYGNDLAKFPGGSDGPLANKARGSMFRYGADVAALPGEGNAYQKLKRLYEESKNPNKGVVKFNPKEAVIDVEAAPVKAKATGLGKYASGIVGGLARGLAEAPKYEFLNPPSAGPSDPEDPVFLFERGLISQEEFNRLMKVKKNGIG
jgi:hypothetical protein